MTCGCGKPRCSDGCDKQGNQLNLAVSQSSRRGLSFTCPLSFCFLMGYHEKECCELDKDRPNPRDDDSDMAANIDSLALAIPAATGLELRKGGGKGRGCRDFSELLGYHPKRCGSDGDKPHHDKPHHDKPHHDKPNHCGPYCGPNCGPDHGKPGHGKPHHDNPHHDKPHHCGPHCGPRCGDRNAALAASEPLIALPSYQDRPGGVIAITFEDKNSHPSAEYITGEEAICVDGRAGAPLRLTVGETYIFEVGESSEGHQFMLTDHPSGGSGAKRCWHEPLVNGRMTVEVSADFPRRCYYQSPKGEFVGGWVMVSGYTNDKTMRESLTVASNGQE